MSPLTSHTQLMKRLPVHTKSVLSGPMTASFTQKQPPRPPWITNWAFFFKGKKGKDRGSAQNGIQCVGEGGSGHQSKAVPAGVHPEVRCPPWVSCSPGPGRRLGSISWTDLVSIRLPVFGLPEGYTLPLTEDTGLERPEVNCFRGKIIYV